MHKHCPKIRFFCIHVHVACSACAARCPKNFPKSESSKEMEPTMCVNVLIYLFQAYGVYVKHLVMDDDNTMYARTRHTKADTVGMLPHEIPEPEKWADLNHRVKCFGNDAYDLANKKGSTSRVDNDIAGRFKKAGRYHFRTRRGMPPEEMAEYWDCPVRHLFGDHSKCTDRCPGKNNPDYKPRKPYLDKDAHWDIYEDLEKICKVFHEPAHLQELDHDFDTNVNEIANKATIDRSPKNLNYSQTYSFSDRAHTMILVHNKGYYGGYLDLCHLLGMPLGVGTADFLHGKDVKKKYYQQYIKRDNFLKSRKVSRDANLSKAAREIADKEEGIMPAYESGIGMKVDVAVAVRKVSRNEKKKQDMICPTCKQSGHGSRTSYRCVFNSSNLEKMAEHKSITFDEAVAIQEKKLGVKYKSPSTKKKTTSLTGVARTTSKSTATIICPHCDGIGHARTTKVDCRLNKKRVEEVADHSFNGDIEAARAWISADVKSKREERLAKDAAAAQVQLDSSLPDEGGPEPMEIVDDDEEMEDFTMGEAMKEREMLESVVVVREEEKSSHEKDDVARKRGDTELVRGKTDVEAVPRTDPESGEADSGTEALPQNGLAATLFEQVLGYLPY